MRIIPFLISGVITLGLIIVLNQRLTVGKDTLPPLGSFLSPQQGFWQNAEDADVHASIDMNFPVLKDKVDIYFDERFVPHVFDKMMKTFILRKATYTRVSDCGKWNFKRM